MGEVWGVFLGRAPANAAQRARRGVGLFVAGREGRHIGLPLHAPLHCYPSRGGYSGALATNWRYPSGRQIYAKSTRVAHTDQKSEGITHGNYFVAVWAAY